MMGGDLIYSPVELELLNNVADDVLCADLADFSIGHVDLAR
jgi:hypothetical protein